ncbi:FAD:protein FMN transferase [Clostridium sp. FP2]|uniref:FAD:protein FMN transferase n=1 Tax=Clostridium TaxID=1485 RepID=UPI0013E95F14|nr:MULTISPECIES: FAD:protein FMN transferase [Clostridium]MBW9155843.1 FAD:protein FMN transferase [Clostridium tagluense]MBZ9624002.1 FAD:protein FMN transferase [Clostridium sp. FP2]WLC63898.1 FAD:protein FMN transferase [Clostridium tagluense]
MIFSSKNKKFKIIAISIVLAITLSACSKKVTKPVEPISSTEFLMGTVCTIKIYDKSSTKVLDSAFKRIREIEDKMSINKEASEVIDINNAAGEKPIKISDGTVEVLKEGLKFAGLTGGKMDITVGPLVKLWGIGTDAARVPSKGEIQEKKALINYKNLILDEKNKTAFLKNKGMIIDLGAIAKGYTADEVSKVLKDNGVEHAIINLGGNVFAMGKNITGTPWKIGIQDPFTQRGDIIGMIQVENKSIVTSGIYERYFEKDGKKYHHILSTSTGYPCDNSIAGVSIVSEKSIDGDALSTSVFSLGLEDGMKFINTMPGVEGIFITKDKQVYTTTGLKDNFKITNAEFTLKN